MISEGWEDYHKSLRNWVNEQHAQINSLRKDVFDYNQYQYDYGRAQFLAEKKFEEQMFLFDGNDTTVTTQSESTSQNRQTRNYFKIPHPCKRLVAEIIDFFIMLVLKISLTFFIFSSLHYFGFVEQFSIDSLVPGFLNAYQGIDLSRFANEVNEMVEEQSLIDVERAIRRLDNLSSQVENSVRFIVLEFIWRIVRILIEGCFLSRNIIGRGPGGATIGKWLMNLRVVSCEVVVPQRNCVEVFPGRNPGLLRAISRSFIKLNTYSTLFYVISTILWQHHRAPYDLAAGTVVVQPCNREMEARVQERPE